MKSEIERIREEIKNTVARVRAEDEQAAQREQEVRHEYDAALERKTAAMDAGDMEAFRAAGMEAEARRLDLEFIEGMKRKKPKPGATVEDDTRIRNALRKELARIRSEGLERLKKRYTETAEDIADIQRQLNALEELSQSWGSVVMRESAPGHVLLDNDRLLFSQMATQERLQLERYKYIKVG